MSAIPRLLHMKILHSQSLQQHLPPAALAISLLAAYLSTLAPGLTWANGGSDGGDLITAAATGGVPHPTGYPLYLLLAKLFQLLPIGSLAYRTNLMSALATACAAVLVYRIVVHSRAPSGSEPGWPAGMAAGYAFGLAPLVWSQAVITEVYALQAFLTALIVYLYTGLPARSDANPQRLAGWRGLALGLAMANHVTTILLLPVTLLFGSMRRPPREDVSLTPQSAWFRYASFDAPSFRRQLAFLALGLSLYVVIPLRAGSSPPVNWGNAVTPAQFWWLVSGRLYQSYYLQFTWTVIGERIQAVAALLLQQFGLGGVVLGLVGLVVFGTRSRLYILTLWTAALSVVFGVLYGSADSYVYLIPMLLCFAIWIGLGTQGLMDHLRQRSSLMHFALGVSVIAYLVGYSFTSVRQVDASHDVRAEDFGREVLARVPPNTILFVSGDRAIFTLWYFHFALKERLDVAVVASDLLHFDWYQQNLRATYPSLIVPGPFPWPGTLARANSARTVCSIQYTDRTEIKCSQPLVSP